MGKKLIIPGADFSENCIVVPLTIIVKAGGSVEIGGVTYSAPANSDKEFEIDSIPDGFRINHDNDLKYLRIGSPLVLSSDVNLFGSLEELEEVIFNADINTGNVARGLFSNCFKLKKFDGSHLFFNTSNIGIIFYECHEIEEIKLLHFNLAIDNMANAFTGCSKLKKVEFDNSLTFVSNPTVTDMFKNCPVLETIIAPSLVASDYNVSGTDTYKFIQGIYSTTGNVTIYCGTGKLTWDGSSWTVS